MTATRAERSTVGVAIVLACFAGLAAALVVGRDDARVVGRLLPDLVAFLAPRDVTDQRVGYLAGLAVFIAAMAAAWRGWRISVAPSRWQDAALIALLLAAVAAWPLRRYVRALLVVASVLTIAAAIWFTHRQKAPPPRHPMMMLAGCYAAVLVVAGFVPPVRLDGYTPEALAIGFESHYASLIADRLQLAAGLPLVDLVQPYYGFLWPVLGAIGERHLGPFDVGGSVRIVQLMQALFVLLYATAVLHYGRTAPFGAAAGLLLVMPWVGTLHPSVLHPNQSGQRFMGFALAVLAVVLAAGRPARVIGLALGAVASACVLINFEAGVAACAGLGLMLLLAPRATGAGACLGALARFAIGFTAVQLAFWAMAFGALGQSPRPLALLLWPLYSDVESSVLGLRIYVDPMIAVITVGAAGAVGHGLLAARRRHLRRSEQVRAATGAMILVWLNYWAGRPHPWNGWSFLVLFAPFVIDLLRPAALRRMRLSARLHRPGPGVAAMVLVILPNLILAQRQGIEPLLRAFAPPPQDAAYLSGALFGSEAARVLRVKAESARWLAAQAEIATVTMSAFSMPALSGIVPRTRARDAVFAIPTEQALANYVAEIQRNAPKFILLDQPDDIPAQFRARFERIVRQLAPAYVESAGAPAGWRLLRRATGEAAEESGHGSH